MEKNLNLSREDNQISERRAVKGGFPIPKGLGSGKEGTSSFHQ